MPEKQFFDISSRFSHYFFLTFCSKMRFRNAQNMVESDFREKFFPAENAGNMPEIAVCADFLWTFSTYFVVFFHTKTFVISLQIQQTFERNSCGCVPGKLSRILRFCPLLLIFLFSFFTFPSKKSTIFANLVTKFEKSLENDRNLFKNG